MQLISFTRNNTLDKFLFYLRIIQVYKYYFKVLVVLHRFDDFLVSLNRIYNKKRNKQNMYPHMYPRICKQEKYA